MWANSGDWQRPPKGLVREGTERRGSERQKDRSHKASSVITGRGQKWRKLDFKGEGTRTSEKGRIWLRRGIR